ncbi:MAG: M28 family peptidase, partial [Pseudomonadota bacterium]
GLEAEIVRFASLNEMFDAPDASIAGKIVFIDEPMTRTQDGSGYGQAVAKRRACIGPAIEKGAVACLIRSVGTHSHRFPHTGMGARGEETGPGPVAALSPPDGDQLTRLLEKGPVTVSLNLQVETKKRVPSGNVVAEIPGVGDLADQIVLLGCHLDSWDLGTGAVDDGAGCGRS